MRTFITKAAISLSIISVLSGCVTTSPQSSRVTAEASSHRTAPTERLGTQWGETVESGVTNVYLQRTSDTPVDVIQIRYAATEYSGRNIQQAMFANGRIGMSILDDNNRKWPFVESGQTLYLKGQDGERYQLFFQNYSQTTYEIVATVDGMDVINGSAGSYNNRGYVLNPNSTLTIQGFRRSQSEVAAFRFSTPNNAYATNNASSGSYRNIGIIGVAAFELDTPRQQQHPCRNPSREIVPHAFPGNTHGNYAPPPCYR